MMLYPLFLTFILLEHTKYQRNFTHIWKAGGYMEEIPWYISVGHSSKNYWQHVCGGSLIHPQWVLSAAHCFGIYLKNTPNLMVNLKSKSNNKYLPVIKIVIHPNFTRGSFDANIALLKLKTPVDSYKDISIIGLPAASQNFPSKMECWVTVWRCIKFRGPFVFIIPLKNLHISVMDALIRDQIYHKTFITAPSQKIFLNDMLCTSSWIWRQKSVLVNSGGPLLCKVQNSWLQTGVISRQIHGRNIISLVTAYVDWINKYIK
ncbi:tryptase beta-2-like isoform X2 [Sminthopsis crassicaudata]|uniref:tryptase beta-2-like isoform X2 n=1 Tax=Sminthopsis crassicaudata TaxID=9301 RepID=UPI003D6829AC